MKASTLSKKLTPTRTLVHFLSASALIFISSASSAEVAGINTLSDAESGRQFDAQVCNNLNADVTEAEVSLGRACSKAGFASTTSCLDTLEDCEGESGKDDPKCINHSISMDEFKANEEREDKIRDQINDLQADYDDEVQNALDIARRKSEADAKLQASLQEVTNGRASALEAEINSMEEITNNIAQQHDKLDSLQLDLRKFILDNEMKCRENAEKYKTAYITRINTRAANGQKRHLSQGQLLSRTGLSVNEAGTIRYNLYLKNCTSLYTKNGSRTGFGSQYIFQKDSIDKQKEIIKREIVRLSQQRAKVKAAKLKALLQLDAVQASAIATHTREVQNLANEAKVSQTKESRLLSKINERQVQLGVAGAATGDAVTQVLLAIGQMRQQTASSERAPASQSEYDAFTDALSARAEVETRESAAASCSSNRDSQAFTTGAAAPAPDVVFADADPTTTAGQTARR
ncbi:MAG: hypothetical protein ACRBBP_10400 [Bdellovibrionales bacterium]